MTVHEQAGAKVDVDVLEEPYPSERYAWYVVLILMIVYIFSFIDRQILALLVGPIKADLEISDTLMSYLMGFSFAVFYTFFGIPMGRLADSKSRRVIIGAGLFVWSFMTAGCGLAKTYVHLLLLRIGVGIGEATLSPSAYSLITDYFKPHRMALALSVYGAGIYIGSGMAFLLGGFVVEYATTAPVQEFPVIGSVRPWQLVFFMIGIPGILFVAVLSTIREPVRRGLLKRHASGAGSSIPINEVIAYIRSNWKTFFCHNLGFALLSFIGYGAAAWIPSFYMRTYGWSPGNTGKLYGIAVIVFGTAGIIYGGYLAGQLGRKGFADSKMRAAMIAAVLHVPLGIVFPLMPEGWMAYLIMLPATFFLAMPFGVAPAAIQEMMPNQMRGQASAIYLFVVNLVGLGVGPSAVAWCTDYLFKDEALIRYSLVLTGTVAGIVASILLWLGLAQFRKTLERRDEWHVANS